MNKRKEGLTHFPVDVDIFDDEKLSLAEERVDPTGYDDSRLRAWVDKVLLRLYAAIYKNGYHILWNEANKMSISKNIGNGMNVTLLNKLVTAFVESGLFSSEMLQEHGILTSHRIQETWLSVVSKARRVHQDITTKYCLLTKDEIQSIKHPNMKSAAVSHKNAAETTKPATDVKPATDPEKAKRTKKAKKNLKNAAETTKPAADIVHKPSKNEDNSVENRKISVGNIENVAEIEEPVTKNIENVAEIEEPFTLINNTNNTTIVKSIDNNILNSVVDFSKKTENVAEVEENVAETKEIAAFFDDYTQDKDKYAPNIVISAEDKQYYKIEVCLFNLTHPNFSRTFETLCIKNQKDPAEIKKWAQAFNRGLVRKAEFKRPMIGNDGWITYFGNWLNSRIHKDVDPDTIEVAESTKSATGNGKSAARKGIPGANASQAELDEYYRV